MSLMGCAILTIDVPGPELAERKDSKYINGK